ncbi:MAG: 50S ribosomal protein L20 [Anaerolineae bacterium]
MRIKGAGKRRRRHKKILRDTKGYWGTRNRLFRRANEAWMKSQWYAYRDRRQRRRDLRRLWITRINAAARQHGMPYSQFIHGLKEANVDLDRKILADLAVRDQDAFAEIVQVAKNAVA